MTDPTADASSVALPRRIFTAYRAAGAEEQQAGLRVERDALMARRRSVGAQ